MNLKDTGKHFLSLQFLKFLLAGGISALINFFSRFLFELYFPFVLSVALSYTLGTCVSFVLNKIFTFKSYEEHTLIQMLKFIIIALISICIASFVVYLIMKLYVFLQISFISEEFMKTIAHLMAIAVTTLYNFFAMKYFSFKKINLYRL